MRLVLLLGFVCLGYLTAQGQCNVSEDDRGQVITTCEVNTYTGNQTSTVYLGSRYLTYPTWLNGVIRVDTSGKETHCELAYDLMTNEVMCRFNGEPKVSILTPYSFTINGLEFVRQINHLLNIDYQLYSNIVHNGPTKLLKSLSNRLISNSGLNGYEKTSKYSGLYQTAINYYIRKGDARPELIELSKESLVSTLYEHSEKIASILPDRKLTVSDVVKALYHYDSLVSVAKIDKPLLSFDPVFNQFLHDKIVYPSQAWLENIYGRVYVGFDVDEAGMIKNITTLSPDNAGFGFDESVRQALKKSYRVRPAYAGHYALPVAYTFTNSQENRGPYVPANTIAPDRLGKRVVLEEFTVPIIISKPIGTTREVWGYYR